MSQIVIGKAGHHNVSIDQQTLLSTRLLLTADSGGGKTWAMKRLIEQAFGHVGILVIDPEGEFAPMRQKLDFYLVGKGGDTPADVRSAAKVARALYGARASAICDIYEMKPSERHAFVREFLDALLEAPKELRRPYLVIVDEAHIFCPEHGKGESEAADSMRGLCTRGRKRLLCPIFATQRLATLAKDASSMLLNRLVGPTFEEVNRKAAIQVLSIPPEGQQQFRQDVQALDPGNFYALGRAITKELTLVHIGPITTPHGEEARQYEIEPPPPTDKVRALLEKLGDLPKQAEEEARTVADFKKQIRELKTQLKAQPKVEVPKPVADTKAIERAVAPLHAMLEKAMKIIVKLNAIGFEGAEVKEADLERLIKATTAEVRKLAKSELSAKARDLDKLKQEAQALLKSIERVISKEAISISVDVHKVSGGEIQPKEHSPVSVQVQARHAATRAVFGKSAASDHPRPDNSASNGLPRTHKRILAALVEFEGIGVESPTRSMVASWLGIKANTGTFKNYLSDLRTGKLSDGQPLIADEGDQMKLTEEGRAAAPEVQRAVTTEELLSRSASVFGSTPGQILRIIHQAHPDFISRESVAEQLGISAETGTFKNYISNLRVAGMVVDGPDKTVKAADWLFID